MKRRIVRIAVVIITLCLLALTANAQSTATRIDSYCTINADGDCMVNLTVTLHIETEEDFLVFPLPANATGITLNKGSAKTVKTDAAILVDISRLVRGMKGDFSMQFDYTIPKAVTLNEEKLEELGIEIKENPEEEGKEQLSLHIFQKEPLYLEIPVLCGFSYPVEKLNYVFVLPQGKLLENPHFSSIYRKNGIESDLITIVEGSMITGESKATLNDHEGVTMSMLVSQEMFPNVSTYRRTGNPEIIPMSVFAALAMLYWILFLRTTPLRRYRNMIPPEGITAGELGCRLTLSGGDLTMMVLSWAQLGYLLIRFDDKGRIILHKRMDMGNERSLFEIRIFGSLFGKRKAVDATGYQYAKLALRVEKMVPGEKTMCKTNSGNMKVFRILCCAVHFFCGICVAMNMTNIFALQILLGTVLSVLGAFSAWHIQEIAYRTHLRNKLRVFIGLGLCLVWIVLGLLAGQVWIPLVSVVGQFIFSYFAAYGGRRSDINRHDVAQILGLRHHVKKIPVEEVNYQMKMDPEYFFNLAPYALALGVLRPFSRNFGKRKLISCPYMIAKIEGRRTAEEWAHIIRETADLMDSRKKQMELERWMPIRLR